MQLEELSKVLAPGELFQVFGEECKPYTDVLCAGETCSDMKRFGNRTVVSVFQTTVDDGDFSETVIGVEVSAEGNEEK